MKIKRNEKGVILIITLWVLAILSLLAISFSQRMRLEIKLAKFQIDSLKALYLAQAGINYALAKLKKDINLYDSLNEDWAFKEEVELKQGKFSFYIEDEERKINLNTAPKSILEKLGLEEDVVCNLIDWRDTDDNVTLPGGAEDEYYQTLNLPYHCKNTSFESIEELLLVKKVTKQILYGEDGINQWITVYGKGVVNINTASKTVLAALLNEELAQNIINERSGPDLKEGTEDDKIYTTTEKYNQIKNLITTDSNNFRITATGIANKIIRKITAVIDMETKEIKYWKEE